ncbi:MAG: hypothetical protein GX977_03870 [Firmicutes bacterium]|nr:hypothetical protein [Bacillota bacterium]
MGFGAIVLIVLYVGIVSGIVALCGLGACLCFGSCTPSCWLGPVLSCQGQNEAEPAMEVGRQPLGIKSPSVLKWFRILITVVRAAFWFFEGSVVILAALQAIRLLSPGL